MHTVPLPSLSLLITKFGAREGSKKITKSPKCWGNSFPLFCWSVHLDPLSLLHPLGYTRSHGLSLLIFALREHKDLTYKMLF